jgi:hypothetical protein
LDLNGGVGGSWVVGEWCNEGRLAALAGFKRSRAAIKPAYPIPYSKRHKSAR